jgi:phosphocarrier protein FPr
LIENTVRAAHKAGKWVGICGALGADPQAIPILVGLGVDELSVAVPTVATTKAQIREITFAESKEIAAKALLCKTAAEVRSLVPLKL